MALCASVTLSVLFIGLHHAAGNVINSNITRDGVIPDVIAVYPGRVLDVRYNGAQVGLGNTLTIEETSQQPEVDLEWSCTLSSLLMVDPDAPSRKNPTNKFWLHWLVVNIRPEEDVSSGEVVTSYAGPNPPKGTGFHRYVFLVYSQSAPINSNSLKASIKGERGHFNLTAITALQEISRLEAVSYFRTINMEQ